MGIFATAAILGYGIKKMVDIDKKNESADKTTLKSLERVSKARENLRIKQEEVHYSIIKLANRKKGILLTTIKEFISYYELLMKIDFTEGAGIKELKNLQLPQNNLKELQGLVLTASTKMSDRKLIGTFILKGIPGLLESDADDRLREARVLRKQANLIESQSETGIVVLEGIKIRADKITEVLTNLNILFMKSLIVMKQAILEKGTNKNLYTDYDKKQIMVTVNFALTIKKIIDSKLIDEEGEITKQSLEALSKGEEYLRKINSMLK